MIAKVASATAARAMLGVNLPVFHHTDPIISSKYTESQRLQEEKAKGENRGPDLPIDGYPRFTIRNWIGSVDGTVILRIDGHRCQ